MKTKLTISIAVLVLAGLLGTFVSQNTDIPLWMSDSGYRIAKALEKEYPFLDVWDFSSDGDFIYIAIEWYGIPDSETLGMIADVLEVYIAGYKTTEKRVVLYDIVKRDTIYRTFSLLSCLTENFGTDGPIYCDVWPWAVRIKPEGFPWVGR